MNYKKTLTNSYDLLSKQLLYSFRIIFANKFIYFLLFATAVFLLITIVSLFSSGNAEIKDVYYLLIFPGLVLIFYPTTFGIQNDEDSRMLENIFAIPNYRYKVWLPRLVMTYILEFLLLVGLALLSSVALVVVPVFDMVYQLMFPVFFIGSLGFALSTVVKNGYGTAVILIMIGLVFWVSAGILEGSEWNIFLNPYDLPSDMSETIWETVVSNNRMYLLSGIIISLLTGLLNLQNREKFI